MSALYDFPAVRSGLYTPGWQDTHLALKKGWISCEKLIVSPAGGGGGGGVGSIKVYSQAESSISNVPERKNNLRNLFFICSWF